MGNYFIYITTNPSKMVLYVGMTNDLQRRMSEHLENKGTNKSFAGKYYCYSLVYWERFETAIDAIDREKQIKRWSRIKKEALINKMNPKWHSLNADLFV